MFVFFLICQLLCSFGQLDLLSGKLHDFWSVADPDSELDPTSQDRAKNIILVDSYSFSTIIYILNKGRF